VIRYEDLVPGTRWVDDKGQEWELFRRGARNHYNFFCRPELADAITRLSEGAKFPGVSGQHYTLITDYHMNMNGWRRA
jgi:hypothetical protein